MEQCLCCICDGIRMVLSKLNAMEKQMNAMEETIKKCYDKNIDGGEFSVKQSKTKVK